MTINAITTLNKPWGICGFASALAAMYTSHTALKATVDAADVKNHLNTRLPAEIKTFLVMLKAEGKISLLNEIRDFTRSFGSGYGTFTIENYIEKINQIATNPALVASESAMRKHNLSIAMPPNAVIEYLKMMHGMKQVNLIKPAKLQHHNVILGLGLPDPQKPYNGLGHYVYMENSQKVYNYGKVGSLSSQLDKRLYGKNRNLDVLFEIQFS